MPAARRGNQGIWIIDAEGKTVYANARMAEILGLTAPELTGRHSSDFVFPEDAAEAARHFESKKHGNADPYEFRLRRKDGTPAWVRIQGTPMQDDAGEFAGIVGTFTPLERASAGDKS